MTEIEFVDVNEWIEERYKKENNGLNFEEMVSGKDMRKKLWEIKVRETRGTYGENLKRYITNYLMMRWSVTMQSRNGVTEKLTIIMRR